MSTSSQTNTAPAKLPIFYLHHTEVNVSFFRVDGVLKHVTESRDFEHRLRALENEVKLKNTFQTELIICGICVALDTAIKEPVCSGNPSCVRVK